MSNIVMPQVTDLAETAALYAVMNRHYTEALRIVTAMTPRERREYAQQLDITLAMINSANMTTPTAAAGE